MASLKPGPTADCGGHVARLSAVKCRGLIEMPKALTRAIPRERRLSRSEGTRLHKRPRAWRGLSIAGCPGRKRQPRRSRHRN
jgi:hypothetical protein